MAAVRGSKTDVVKWVICALCVFGVTTPSFADPAARLFEEKIRPLLAKHCYECHSASADSVQGELRLDTKQGWQSGGISGPAIEPGNVDQSLMLQAVRYERDDLLMPPSGKLSEASIADLEQWIKSGAYDPREDSTSDIAVSEPSTHQVGLDHWAFQKPQGSVPPAVVNPTWAFGEIDRYLQVAHEREGLQPVSRAKPLQLLRRVCLDLVGLPPDQSMIERFARRNGPQAYVELVDELLARPGFGERWGRHWLDVTRFAESVGSTRNLVMRQAWRYREYVIDSFNRDQPYDEFVRAQIAGDLLRLKSSEKAIQQRIATGFLAIGSRSLAEKDPLIVASDEVAEQVDAVGRAFLGLNLSCARCHDHKFAPISTEEFYGLAGIFRSTQTMSGMGRLGEATATRLRFDLLNPATEHIDLGAFESDRQVLRRRLEELTKQLDYLGLRKREIEDAEPFVKQDLEDVFAEMKEIREQWRKLNYDFADRYALAMGASDRERPVNARVEIGGDPHRIGAEVDRGFLLAMDLGEASNSTEWARSSGRLSLANWVTHPENPLLARVIVNRVWQKLLGRGLVFSVDDFTPTGSLPSHPDLLDHLATSFVADGYSVKKLIRRIVLTRVYQQSSQFDAANNSLDPDNQWWWRMNRRRLELEPLRDAMLAVSGNLDRRRPSKRHLPVEDQVPNESKKWPAVEGLPFRTVYLPVLRRALPRMFREFDFPPPDQVMGARAVTTVPTQALFIMNSPFVEAQSAAAATRLIRQVSGAKERAKVVFLTTVGRLPTHQETSRIEAFVRQQTGIPLPEDQIWQDVFHARFSSAEFLYRD